MFNFYLFFGICFGDVFYGLMLVALSLYLRSKTKPYPAVYNFSTLFLYSGVSTMVFGALLGSWFGDLWKPEYLGEGNALQRLHDIFFAGLDPLARPLPALVLALLIGVLNQFYGISLKIYGAVRIRDWAAAIFDGAFWLVMLSGLLLSSVGVVAGLPSPVVTVGLACTVLGAVGLVLTQGRDVPGVGGKLAAGLISLYGILGSYGITAFVGDTLSYCRLLALGVTTSVVAMAANIMAGMLRDVPYVGFVLFVLVLIAGHLFNFGISVLGAFVHSMRLIFVEFFGRFYEGGARAFTPLCFDSPECRLDETSADKARAGMGLEPSSGKTLG
jgi:V/A-type H+-transporting ATPase subunit I